MPNWAGSTLSYGGVDSGDILENAYSRAFRPVISAQDSDPTRYQQRGRITSGEGNLGKTINGSSVFMTGWPV